MELINLSEFKAKPNPLKAELKKHGVAPVTLANYLGLSYPHIINILNGIFPLHSKYEEKINNLLFSLESQPQQ